MCDSTQIKKSTCPAPPTPTPRYLCPRLACLLAKSDCCPRISYWRLISPVFVLYIKCFTCTQTYILFCIGFWGLLSQHAALRDSPIACEVSACSLSWLSGMNGFICIYLFIHPPVYEHWSHFQLGVITNVAAGNRSKCILWGKS